VPHLGTSRHQLGDEMYGVISNPDDAGSYEYITGVRVSEFPDEPTAFSRRRIPRQTYAVFEHKEHVFSIGSTWDSKFRVPIVAGR
jgi:AraC family transcriptional regulator